MSNHETIDWSVLSGPRVSRRTLLQVAAASGAAAYASQLTGAAGAPVRRRPLASLQDPVQGGTLRWGFGLGQIPTLDPAQVNLGIVAGELLSNLFSGLVQFDEELGIVADLADEWMVSEDGLTYTFNLRPGLTFHNGDTLTANDFIYTYERTTNPDFASPQANKLALVTDIQAPDETTLVITQSAPNAPFLAVACSRGPGRALTPISQRAVEEMGDEQFGLAPVGCGPFMIDPETVEVGGGFEMNAFEGWYGGRPLLDKVVVQLVAEPSTLVSALEAGDVDMVDIVPLIGYDQLAGNDELTLVEAAGTNWIGLAMNQARPPWDNVEARMAVAKAIDRDDLIDKAFFGRSTPSVGFLAPAFGWVYRPPEEVEDPQAFNLDEARQLAQAAGLDGVQPGLIGTPADQRVTETIRNQLSEIGLDVQLDQMQTNAYVERRTAGDYDMTILGSVVDADPDDGCWNYFHSTGPSNSYAYNNPEADRLSDAQRQSNNQEERTTLLQELQTLVSTDAVYAFLYHNPDITGFYTYVQGYRAIPEQRYLETVWLDQ
ncbi:MAG: ABC transporter substrate-binding protein [Chloroflexota bacterium]|nr:ABC transporter substrate-binding protein [Chloroflexota bacterium]